MKGRWQEAPVLVAVFLDLLGFGMVIADIQLRAEAMVPKGWSAGLVVGGLLTATFITQTVVSPHWGRLSDRAGRKPIFIACTLLSACAMLVYALAGNLWVLLASRILSGLGAANIAVVQAFVSDKSAPGERTAALGRIGAAMSAGLVIGPPVGGFLAAIGGNALIGVVAGSASLLGVILIAVLLPNPRPAQEREPGKAPVIDLRLLKEFPQLRRLVLIAIVAWFSLATLEGTFARLIEHLYHYDQREFGVLFGYESLLTIVVQGVLLAGISRIVKDQTLLRLAYLVQGIGLALNPYAGALGPAIPAMAILFVASSLYATGSALANPTVNSLCSKLTPDSRQGELFGLLQGTRSIGFVLGPMIGGVLFDWHNAAPYLLSGIVCILAALLVPKSINGYQVSVPRTKS